MLSGTNGPLIHIPEGFWGNNEGKATDEDYQTYAMNGAPHKPLLHIRLNLPLDLVVTGRDDGSLWEVLGCLGGSGR